MLGDGKKEKRVLSPFNFREIFPMDEKSNENNNLYVIKLLNRDSI